MIDLVTQDSIREAAEIHAISWRESHRAICSPAFVALHTTERQTGYLRSLLEQGAAIYLLSFAGRGVGIVSVQGDLIGDLYVLPSEQRKGYGTALLQFAMSKCTGTPTMWVLDSNQEAIRLYERNGFRLTGKEKTLSETLAELEMKYVE